MKTKIKLKNILDKYIIVVDGDEKKIVYDVDDERIFSVHITGCGRGARNASLNNKTFKTSRNAEKGIKYLDTCYWSFKFKAMKVSELEVLNKAGYEYLISDIDSYNSDVDFYKEMEKERKKESKAEYLKLRNAAIDLVNSNVILSIEELEDEDAISIVISR